MTAPFSTGLTAESSAVVIDTNGRRITGDITIEFMPGNGISGPDGRHLDRENGPHTLPVAFALPLMHSNRARRVDTVPQADGDPGEDEKKEEKVEKIDPAAQVHGAPAGVQQRDPKPRKR